MRSKVLFVVYLFLSCCLTAFSEEYHFAAVYDVTGHVKEIKTESKFSLIKKKVKINKDGRGGLDIMSYDDSGFPTGFELNAIGKLNFQKFFWNTENRLDSAAIQFQGVGSERLITVKMSIQVKML